MNSRFFAEVTSPKRHIVENKAGAFCIRTISASPDNKEVIISSFLGLRDRWKSQQHESELYAATN